ncbi:kanadaptin [Conger conger]|uniref:kanadaptin n=1 Tax=Conger conger TaxID=82655 RepID=UPI002A5AE7CF|nr:kanadaptin [Conger conger]
MADFNSTCITKAEKTSDQEMDVDQETENGSVNKKTGELEAKEGVGNDVQDANDPFKKPAIFSAPSLARRAGVTPTCAAKKVSPESDKSKEHHKPEKVLGTDDLLAGKTGADNEEESNSNDNHSTESVSGTADSTNQCDKDKSKSVSSSRSVTLQKVNPRVSVKLAPVGNFKPGPPLAYSEPPWGGVSEIRYSLEILKNGAIVDTVPLTQSSYFVVGRLPLCDVSLEHPSISRYHSVLQYRLFPGEEGVVGEESGFYAFDLGSTHGTFVNKNKIPPKTYIRIRVGHMLKFGGSTRLFILQGPESDEEAESELTVTELRERARKQRETLEKRMMGEGSDEEDEKEGKGDEEPGSSGRGGSKEDAGCSWGMEEDAVPEEDENEENPFATEFQEDQEAAYLKDPKKALQGFFDREGEELEYEYDDKAHGTWLCRVKLPVDDAAGRQLVAEVTHTGKKKEAAIQCSLEACRILEARGLLRQEAVSRKRKKKNWEDEDYYDSDDDTFLDRTGVVERKRKERMKRAGKIEERPETYDSLVLKLAGAEKELTETEKKLSASEKGGAHSSSEDPLDAFMSEVRSSASMDGVERRKLHLHVSELRREAARLRRLVELTRPAQLPALQPGSQSSDPGQPRKLVLPLFGAMKGGSKFRLKTGTVGKIPPKRAELPPQLFNLKELPPGGEEEEEEEEEEDEQGKDKDSSVVQETTNRQSEEEEEEEEPESPAGDKPMKMGQRMPRPHSTAERTESDKQTSDKEEGEQPQSARDACTPAQGQEGGAAKTQTPTPPKSKGKRRMVGPSRPPVPLSTQYPEDDPDYCVWMPPTGQTGDGRTHLNDKYGY